MKNFRVSPLFIFFTVLLFGIVLTSYSVHKIEQTNQRKLQAEFGFSTQKIFNNISHHFQSYITIMNGVKGFFDGSEYISHDEFHNYIQALGLNEQLSGVQGIGLATLVSNAEITDHITEHQSQGADHYRIFPEGERDFYIPIIYMEPINEANKKVIGYDIATVPGALKALNKARDFNTLTISPKLTLKQMEGEEDEFGFVMYLPLYRDDVASETLASRLTSIRGWVDVPFQMKGVMTQLSNEFDTDINVTIYDGLELTEENVLYQSEIISQNQRQSLATRKLFEIGGRTWTILLSSTPNFKKRILNDTNRIIVILFGLFTTLILSLLAWSLARSKELAQQNYSQLFQQAGEGIFVLSNKSQFVDANPAALELVGCGKQQLTNKQLLDVLHSKEIAGISDVITSIMSGKPHKGEWTYLRKDGAEFIADVSACRLDDKHFFTIVRDLTEKKEAEKELRLSAKVFESSKEGIMVTNANNVIISVNDAYCEMSGYHRHELIGIDPNILSSGIHSKEFYASMWNELLNKGVWRGEVTDQRKNGEIFPQWMSLSVVKNTQGLVVNYIGIMRDLSVQRASEEKIRFLSNFDQLTQLPNFDLLKDRVTQAIATAQRADYTVALLYIDLDRFKIVNDSLGMKVGDQLLKQVSERIVSNLNKNDTLSRQGGDEFILMLHRADPDEAAHVARNLLSILAQPFTVDEESIIVTASMGLSMFPEDGSTFEELLQAADVALFQSKSQGRNAFRFFTQSMQEHAKKILQVETELRDAIEKDEFILHYQPQIDAISREIIGLEALIRWQHPNKGLISPALFIPVAEECDLIIDLGYWVIRTVIAQQVHWQESGIDIVPVAVNLSVVQCRDQSLYENVNSLLREVKLDPAMLELEITEGVAMDSSKYIVDMLKQFHDLGVQLSIDDFGTGYSSLSYLKQFDIDKLKIDQSFIRDLAYDNNDEAIVTAIIEMSKALGFKTIAEGVETQDQLELLCEKGCDEMQGYYFSKPIPMGEVTEMLEQNIKFT
jgi:diguanylate cyclase (GGDEF)-like protein/PAS domain S-box-containing protein